MNGHVSGRQARISIPFHVAGQPDFDIEFVVDTGFAGFLTLPLAAIAVLNLQLLRKMLANLADDSDTVVSVYSATITWEGIRRDVEVLAMGKRPLLGTALQEGF